MENEFLNLVSSPLMNLDHTYRYSGTKLVESESLSQHIVDTIMMGLKMIDEINHRENSIVLDPYIYVMKAIYHDLEEAITGDIPRPLKYFNNDTLQSMRVVADEVAHDLFSKQFHQSAIHYEIWDSAKDGKEGHILKLVDNLVVVNKVIKEVSVLHNYYMLKVAHEVYQYTSELKLVLLGDNTFSETTKKYLDSVMSGAISSLKKLLDDNKEAIDSLFIVEQSML